MEKPENLEEFYKRKFDWIPDSLRKDIGHFNIFKLDPLIGKNARPVPYKRRDFYKIMLVIGGGTVHYADRTIRVEKQALSFSNPQIPYKWENTDEIESGVYCIFDRAFFDGYGNIDSFPVFQPQGEHLFELSEDQEEKVARIFKRMFDEINSEYTFKYDAIRNLVMELVHYGMKMNPFSHYDKRDSNASQRISTLFLELLERQFPIDEDHVRMNLRSPSQFAEQLNVHVNHLNRAIKETMSKTTSQIIAERILKESKALLMSSHWAISDIAYALEFKEVTHFSNFFKKHTEISPSKFRTSVT